MIYIAKLTHEQRKARRAEAVQAVVDGVSKSVVCKRFGVSLQWLRDSCREEGVQVVHEHRVDISTYSILADLLNTLDSLEVIAGRHGISRQRVHQILRDGRAGGIKFPARPKSRSKL